MPVVPIEFSRYPILVVDDEQDNLDIIRFNYRSAHPLLFAVSGASALEVLASKPVAVIVSDQRMPGMSGLELLRHAHHLRPEVVGMLLTAFADVPLLVEAINTGLVYRLVQKPFSAAELGAAIRQAVERFHLVGENHRLSERLAHE